MSRLQYHRNRCCRPSIRHANSSRFTFALLVLIVLLSIVHRSSQVLEFLEEPSSYYYTRPGFATIIPCQAVDVDPNTGNQIPVAAVISINGMPILDNEELPPHHTLWLRGGVVSGILVIDTLKEFSGWIYSCRAERDGRFMVSLNSTLYVGDGRPLAPVEDPCYMTDAGLSSLTLLWGYAPVPPDAPLLGYNITYWSLGNSGAHESMETNDNDTTITLHSLSPGTSYTVVVQGVNRFGAGNLSAPLNVTTMVGSLPPAPTNVMATVELVTQSLITIAVKWKSVMVDPADSTPVLDYSIYYNDFDSLPVLVKTATGSAMSITVKLRSDNISTQFVMGVAARNLAGGSESTYSEVIHILVNPQPAPHSVSLVLIGGIVGAIVLLVIASVLIFIVIICIRHRISNMQSYHVKDTESPDKSPESPRKNGKTVDTRNDLFGKADGIPLSDLSPSCRTNVHITVEETKLNDKTAKVTKVRVKRPSLDNNRNHSSNISKYYDSRTL